MLIDDPALDKQDDALLIPYLQQTDITVMQDFWWLTARAIEESLVYSGAKPGEDYDRLDLYKLAQPLVLHRFKKTDMDIQAHQF